MARGVLSRIMYNKWLWILGLLLLLFSFIHQLAIADALVPASPWVYPLDLFPGFSGLIVSAQSLSSSAVEPVISLVALLAGGLMIQFLSSNYRLVRVRSFFPFFLYCVVGATFFPYVSQPFIYIASVLLLGACLRIFSVTEEKEMNRALFDAAILIAMASLAFSRLLWLLPFFWLAVSRSHSIRFSHLLASVLGFVSLYWLVGGLSFVFSDYRLIQNMVQQLLVFEPINLSDFTPVAMVYLAFAGFLFLVAFTSFIRQQNQDKLLTRNNLYAVFVLWLGGLLLWLMSPSSDKVYLFLLTIPTLVFYAHYFSLNDGVFARLLFYLYLLGSVLTFFLFQ